MQRSWVVLVAAILFSGLSAKSSDAASLFDQSLFLNGSGLRSGDRVSADNFSLSQAASVTNASVFIVDPFEVERWDGAFQYFVYADDSLAPGDQLGGGEVAYSLSDTGEFGFGNNILQVDFDFLSPISLAANVTYWLSIHMGADVDFDNRMLWMAAPSVGYSFGPGDADSIRAFNTVDGGPGPWTVSTSTVSAAFQLFGDAAPVPAPAVILLLLTGLLGLGVLRAKNS